MKMFESWIACSRSSFDIHDVPRFTKSDCALTIDAARSIRLITNIRRMVTPSRMKSDISSIHAKRKS